MRETFKKDPDSYQEANTITLIQSDQENPEVSATTEETECIDLRCEKVPNNLDISDLLDSFQEMKEEEKRLLEIKQQILTKQQDLQNKLAKEIEKKKATIANLTSEIPDLENRIQELGQALGVDIYK